MINQFLFDRLREAFGWVGVINQDQPNTVAWNERGYPYVACIGEMFKFDCPHCGKPKHAWCSGEFGNTMPDSHLRVLSCGCYVCEELKAREILDRITWTSFSKRPVTNITDNPNQLPVSPYLSPGRLSRLTSGTPLAQAACEYLTSRNIRIDIAEQYGCMVVEELSEFEARYHGVLGLVGRIYVPAIVNGQAVGWQLRAPVAEPRGEGMFSDAPPKWFSMCNMADHLGWIQNTVMGYDQVRQASPKLVVLCEGAGDMLRQSPYAVAMLGMSPGDRQLKLIIDTWGLEPTNRIIVCLDQDGDPFKKSESKNAAKIVGRLRDLGCKAAIWNFRNYPPGTKDIGEWDQAQFIAAVTEYIRAMPNGEFMKWA